MKWKNTILAMEEIVIFALRFDFGFENPYKQLLNILDTELCNECKGTDLKMVSWSLLNDSFYNTFCIRYSPDIIAKSCIIFALILLKIDSKHERKNERNKDSKSNTDGSIMDSHSPDHDHDMNNDKNSTSKEWWEILKIDESILQSNLLEMHAFYCTLFKPSIDAIESLNVESSFCEFKQIEDEILNQLPQQLQIQGSQLFKE